MHRENMDHLKKSPLYFGSRLPWRKSVTEVADHRRSCYIFARGELDRVETKPKKTRRKKDEDARRNREEEGDERGWRNETKDAYV